MFGTVKTILRQGVVTYDSHSRSQWALDHPGQVVLTVVSYCIVCWALHISLTCMHDSLKINTCVLL